MRLEQNLKEFVYIVGQLSSCSLKLRQIQIAYEIKNELNGLAGSTCPIGEHTWGLRFETNNICRNCGKWELLSLCEDETSYGTLGASFLSMFARYVRTHVYHSGLFL